MKVYFPYRKERSKMFLILPLLESGGKSSVGNENNMEEDEEPCHARLLRVWY